MKNSLRRPISATALLIVFFGLLFYPLVKVEHVKVTINEFFELNRFSLLPDGQRIFLYDRKNNNIIAKDIQSSYERGNKLYVYGPYFQGIIERQKDQIQIFVENTEEKGKLLRLRNEDGLILINKSDMNKEELRIFEILKVSTELKEETKQKEMIVKIY